MSTLKAFIDIGEYEREHLVMLVVIHMTFVISGLLLAVMDYVSGKAAH